jgi:hypothetical protein
MTGTRSAGAVFPERFKTPACIFPLILFLFGCFQLGWGEIVPVNAGFGWDGMAYGQTAELFWKLLVTRKLNPYDLQRCLPSALVHYGLVFFQAALSPQSILLGFRILNLILLTGAGFVWGLVVGELKLRGPLRWFSGILFCNFFALKFYFYLPVLTDQTAFFLAVCLLYFYLKKKRAGVLTVSILGFFTWPLSLLGGLLLYLWPQRETAQCPSGRKSFFLAALLAGLYVGAAAYLCLALDLSVSGNGPPVKPFRPVLGLSLAGTFACLLFGSFPLLNQRYVFSRAAWGEAFRRKSVAALLIPVFLYGAAFLAFPTAPRVSTLFLVKEALIGSIHRPFFFLVVTVVYYGPAILLGIFLWRKIVRHVATLGLGATLYFLMYLFIFVNEDPRKIVFLFPFATAMMLKACEEMAWPATAYRFLGVMSLLYSKVWLWINATPLTGDYQRFPYQYLFMSVGIIMSDAMYVVQGCLVILTGVFFYFWLFDRR